MKRTYAGFASIHHVTNVITRTPCHHELDDTDEIIRRINADRIDVSYFMNESDESILSRYASVEV